MGRCSPCTKVSGVGVKHDLLTGVIGSEDETPTFVIGDNNTDADYSSDGVVTAMQPASNVSPKEELPSARALPPPPAIPANAEFAGELWLKGRSGLGKLFRIKRYFVLRGKHLSYCHCKEGSRTWANPEYSFYALLSENTVVSRGQLISTKTKHHTLSPGGKRVRRKLKLYPIVIHDKDNDSNDDLEVFCEREDEAKEWIDAMERAMDSSVSVVAPVSRRLSLTQLDKQFDSLIAEAEALRDKDRWLLARKCLSEIESTLARAADSTSAEDLDLVSKVQAKFDSKMEFREEIVNQAEWAEKQLAEFESMEGWTPVSSSGGVSVYHRAEEGTPINSIMVDTVFEADFLKLFALLAETDLAKEWIPFCTDTKLLHRVNDFHCFVLTKLEFPFFVPLSNRDWVIEGRGVDILEQDTILVMTRCIKESPLCEIPDPEPGFVRIELNGGFHIKLLDEGTVRLRLITNSDLKLPVVSASIVNFMNKSVAGQSVHQFRKMLRRFDETSYPQRMKERPDFYEELSQRIRRSQDIRETQDVIACESKGIDVDLSKVSFLDHEMGEDESIPQPEAVRVSKEGEASTSSTMKQADVSEENPKRWLLGVFIGVFFFWVIVDHAVDSYLLVQMQEVPLSDYIWAKFLLFCVVFSIFTAGFASGRSKC